MTSVISADDQKHSRFNRNDGKMPIMKKYLSDILSVLIATSFGLLAHSTFANDDLLVVMTMSFIFILPFGIGALAIWPLMG